MDRKCNLVVRHTFSLHKNLSSTRIKGAPYKNLLQCTCINHFCMVSVYEWIVMWHEKRGLPISLSYWYEPVDDLIKLFKGAIYKNRPHVVFTLPKNSGQKIVRVTITVRLVVVLTARTVRSVRWGSVGDVYFGAITSWGTNWPGASWLACKLRQILYLCNTIHRRLWHYAKSVISSHSVDNFKTFLDGLHFKFLSNAPLMLLDCRFLWEGLKLDFSQQSQGWDFMFSFSSALSQCLPPLCYNSS